MLLCWHTQQGEARMLNLWSKRWSTAKGWHWKLERDCLPENKDAWLDVSQKDEPTIEFKVRLNRPKL